MLVLNRRFLKELAIGMIYSKTCEYAIRALTYLATKEQDTYTMVVEVNGQTGVPGPYIAKVFQNLVRKGILKSQRGPSGGFSFKKRPEDVSLLEIVEAIDDFSLVTNECVMGLNQCEATNACPLHHIWKDAKAKIVDELENSSLVHVTKKVGKLQYRGLKRSRLNESLGLTA